MGKYNVNQQLYALGKYMSAFEAVQEGLGKRVEIRILSQRAAEGSIELSRFQSEIKNLANLDHPAILRVLDCGVANGKLYYVVELKRRLTIQEWLAQTPPPPIEDRLRVVVQLAAALKYMHGKGIIHRGVDETSVNYDPEIQQSYISQFSFVKNTRTDNLTARGIGNVFQLLTTPEGAMGQTLDARSDVFLLGVLAFKMASGQDAYSPKAFLGLTAETGANVQQKKLRETDASASEILEKCLVRACAVMPADRYQTMQEFHDALIDAGKKMKLPKWADRKDAAQPVSASTISETGDAAGPPSGAQRALAAAVKAASSGDARASRVGNKLVRRPGAGPSSGAVGPETGAESAVSGANAGASGAAGQSVGEKLKALAAQINGDPQKKKMAIGAGLALLGVVALIVLLIFK